MNYTILMILLNKGDIMSTKLTAFRIKECNLKDYQKFADMYTDGNLTKAIQILANLGLEHLTRKQKRLIKTFS